MYYSCNNAKISDLSLRLAVQRIEIDSALIRRGAIQEFGLDDGEKPSSNQRASYYIGSGRAQEIADLFSEDNFWAVEERLGFNPRTLEPMQCLNELWEEYHQHHPGVNIPLLL